jgi:protease I
MNEAPAMKRAVIITAPGFQDEEFVYPYYRLLEAGFRVDVATKDKATVHGKYGVPAVATVNATDLREPDYDLVVLPGGHEAPDRVRQIKEVLSFVRAMDESGKVVAALCHGPWIAISAGIVKGRRATCYQGMADDLRNAGAIYVDAAVVEDGNLITAPHYRNNGDFMKAVVARFER